MQFKLDRGKSVPGQALANMMERKHQAAAQPFESTFPAYSCLPSTLQLDFGSLQVSIDSRGLMKVTHMLSLQSFGADRQEVTHPLASLDSQVGEAFSAGACGHSICLQSV